MDMVNLHGKMTKSVKIRGNSTRKVVISDNEFVKLHKNIIRLLRDLTKS
jgi:predicted metal-binding transcription factor (methanogenesis marker protein 9)